MPIYSQVKTRYQYLIGENSTTPDDVGESHINYAIKDICNARPFSWNLTTTDLTLTAGVATLPANYNSKWGIQDARLINATVNDDNVFTLISIQDRDKFQDTDYVYWLTTNATTGRQEFNTPLQTGTVTIYYYFVPADLTADDNVCFIPDAEAVAYLAASKYWLSDDNDTNLKTVYEQEASSRIQQMYSQDLNFGPTPTFNSIIDYNSHLGGN
jgi:hypothetical protein